MDGRIDTKVVRYVDEVQSLSARLRESIIAGDAENQYALILRLHEVASELKEYNLKMTDSK